MCHLSVAYDQAVRLRLVELLSALHQIPHLHQAYGDFCHHENRDDASLVRLARRDDFGALHLRDDRYRLRTHRWNRWYP